MTVSPHRRILLHGDASAVCSHVMKLLGFRRAARYPLRSGLAWAALLFALALMLASVWVFRRSTGWMLVGILIGLVVLTVSIIVIYRARGFWFAGHGTRLGLAWTFLEKVAHLEVRDERGVTMSLEIEGATDPKIEDPPPRPALYATVVEFLADAAGAAVGRSVVNILPLRRVSLIRGLVILGAVLGILEDRGFSDLRRGRHLGAAETGLSLIGIAIQVMVVIGRHWVLGGLVLMAMAGIPIALRVLRGSALWCTREDLKLKVLDRLVGETYQLRVNAADRESTVEIAADAILSGGLTIRHEETLERLVEEAIERVSTPPSA